MDFTEITQTRDSDQVIFDEQDLLLFEEPPDFKPSTPPPSFTTFTRDIKFTIEQEGRGGESNSTKFKDIIVRLVGSHPLWGHYLWNAAKCLANYLDENKELVCGKNVLEFGAGAGLPSLIANINGAEKVVITDYPDEQLLDNIKYNVANIFPNKKDRERIIIMGYIWGKDTTPLLNSLDPTGRTKFDTIILSDLIFNHSQHHSLLRVCKECIDPINGQILVFFTHHRPNLIDRDMNFFELAIKQPFNLSAEKILEHRMAPMFENDPGSESVRATVHGYRLTRC
ncbi:8714_t:CDS:2 [Ambispora gerdemannii]|uniref:Protein N-terminal and lysine N-methyltransferase EFM7 n=1 Tax=Ambispora gerdemannii TaxID=144530 RepID=A0A9N8W6Z4_9GLOM|nr:8714_t:CDS:2 [Ambispora gerdemannii]